jgi:NAD(P)H-dependent FMN reductase
VRQKILAICGSTRQRSANLDLISAIIKRFSNIEVEIFKGLDAIPHFNPDLDNEEPPGTVLEFRNRLKEADGVLICTPEYAMGVPGTLKNAIDWTVSSMEFSHKPTALITASTSGEKGHRSLMETLKVIEAEIPDSSQLLIPHIKTKLKSDEIIHPDTLTHVENLINSLINSIKEEQNVK